MKQSKTYPIYRKTIFYYSLLIVSMVVILEGNFLLTTKRQKMNTVYNQQMQIVREVQEELKTLNNYTKNCMYQLYETESALNDMISYMRLDPKHYIKEKLDAYVESKQYVYENREHFIQNAFLGKRNLERIDLVSYKNEKITKYGKKDVVQIEQYYPQFFLVNEEQQGIEGEYFVEKRFIRKNIMDEPVGEIHFLYSSQSIKNICQNLDPNIGLYVGKDDKVFFHSENGVLEQAKESQYQIVQGTAEGFDIVCYMDKKQASKLPNYLNLILIALGIGLIGIGELLVHLYMKSLSDRLRGIIDTMEEVKKGNLSVRLPIKKQEDELDIIALNLNDMCQELKSYIDKSYLAEIGQKKAEMEAMQNQINPHFLYNTLEAIRMKAMINQDKEVGKMLYGLAVIFRSQIKENPIIPIAKELYFCKQYLELYKFRHPNRFLFDVVCPNELMEYPILKFCIQPIIENYFAHGIRAQDMDNYVLIEVKEDPNNKNDILIEVVDNGKGMTEEEIEAKNKELDLKEQNQEYIGLSNIQMRLKIEFGEMYGISLSRGIHTGLKVTMKIPKRMEKAERENSNV